MSNKKDFNSIGNDAFNTFLTNDISNSTSTNDKSEEIKRGRPQNNTNKSDHTRVNGTNKKDNYTITLKIDADVEDYLKNIIWINRKTSTAFINELIREDLKKRLKLKNDATYEDIQNAWEEYKKVNNI